MIAVRTFSQGGRTDLKKLSGSERWRIRVGDWRVVIRLVGEVAYVVSISDRQDAY